MARAEKAIPALSPVRHRIRGIPVCAACLEPCRTCDDPAANGICLGCREGTTQQFSYTVN